jgi:hypothetical protein
VPPLLDPVHAVVYRRLLRIDPGHCMEIGECLVVLAELLVKEAAIG